MWQPIKLNSLVESDKKQLRLLRIWKVIKTLLNSLNYLVKETINYGGRADVNAEAVGGSDRFTVKPVVVQLILKCTIRKLRALIKPLGLTICR